MHVQHCYPVSLSHHLVCVCTQLQAHRLAPSYKYIKHARTCTHTHQHAGMMRHCKTAFICSAVIQWEEYVQVCVFYKISFIRLENLLLSNRATHTHLIGQSVHLPYVWNCKRCASAIIPNRNWTIYTFLFTFLLLLKNCCLKINFMYFDDCLDGQ